MCRIPGSSLQESSVSGICNVQSMTGESSKQGILGQQWGCLRTITSTLVCLNKEAANHQHRESFFVPLRVPPTQGQSCWWSRDKEGHTISLSLRRRQRIQKPPFVPRATERNLPLLCIAATYSTSTVSPFTIVASRLIEINQP